MKLLKNSNIFHIDMDAFYASVEQADCPELSGKRVVIGGKSKRSVVSAASYEARRFGVRSAMPMYEALKKCPDAIVLPVRMVRYKLVSQQIMGLLKTFSPVVEQVSIDEAFMDVSGFELLWDSPIDMAHAIKKQIKAEFGLTCSIGIAPVKFLAKIASDLDKPDGIMEIAPDAVDAFIQTLPVEKIPGVGKKTYEILSRMGVKFLGDVRKIPEQTLVRELGKTGRRLTELVQGLDASKIKSQRQVKSVSSEETFAKDTMDERFLKLSLLRHAGDVGKALRQKKIKSKTIAIKIKHADFTQAVRSTTLPSHTQSTETIYETAVKLFENYSSGKPIRLIGVSAAMIVPADHPEQMSLFDNGNISRKNWEKIDHVLDAISEKYGEDVVKKAVLETRDSGKFKDED